MRNSPLSLAAWIIVVAFLMEVVIIFSHSTGFPASNIINTDGMCWALRFATYTTSTCGDN